MKTAIKWLFAALLVALPAAILLTGWTEALFVAKGAVSVYATIAIASVIAVAFTLYAAKTWRGEDFGEKQHKWLIAKELEHLRMTSFETHYHAIRGAVSAVLFLALGLPICAALLVLVSVAIYVVNGAISSYFDTYGRRATTGGYSRKHYEDSPS
jgi:hypothetical protein